MSDAQRNASTDRVNPANLLLLSWAAGSLDGLSYIRSHVFTANMTGNIVLLGIHWMQHDIPDALRSLVALTAFVIGCFLAGVMLLEREDQGRRVNPVGFTAEFLLLIVFAVLFQWNPASSGYLIRAALIMTAALALAVQSVIVRNLRVSGVATTFITGTITTSVVGLVRIFRKNTPPERESEERHVVLLGGMLILYFTGVIYAALLSSRAPMVVGATPAATLGIVLWRSRIA